MRFSMCHGMSQQCEIIMQMRQARSRQDGEGRIGRYTEEEVPPFIHRAGLIHAQQQQHIAKARAEVGQQMEERSANMVVISALQIEKELKEEIEARRETKSRKQTLSSIHRSRLNPTCKVDFNCQPL